MTDPPRRDRTLRAVTFNVRNGRARDGRNAWPNRRHLARAALVALHPSVVGLQEADPDQIDDVLDALDGFRSVGGGRVDGRSDGEHVPILFDAERFELVRSATVWFGDEPHVPGSRLPDAGHPRIATFARLDDRVLGTELEVVNLHLDEKHQRNRARSVEQLCGWIGEPLPRLVLGDFNARPGNGALRPLATCGYSSALPPDAGGTVHGFRGGDDGAQIDHVFVSPHWQILDWRVLRTGEDGVYPSDHWPVLAEVALRTDG